MEFDSIPGRPSVSRRGFIKHALMGSAGTALLASSSMSTARSTQDATSGVGGIVRMNLNENPIGPSPMAVDAVRRHADSLNRYGSETSSLFVKLNRMAGIEYSDLNLNTSAGRDDMWRRNRIYLSDGSGSILKAAAFTFLRNGGEVIEAEPGYGEVSEHASFLDTEVGINVNIRRVPLTEDMRHDIEAMHKAVNRDTRLVVITNPNNPTGTIAAAGRIEQLVASMPDHVVVLIDEAYAEYVEDASHESMAPLAATRPNVIVTRTFSKVFGLAALKIGYAVAMPETLKNFWVHTGFPSPVAIQAATAAMDDTAHIASSQQTVWEGREYLYGELDRLGLTYVPTEANFLVVRVANPSRVSRDLARQNVYVRNAERLWNVPGHVRVSIGTRRDNEAFIQALKRSTAT